MTGSNLRQQQTLQNQCPRCRPRSGSTRAAALARKLLQAWKKDCFDYLRKLTSSLSFSLQQSQQSQPQPTQPPPWQTGHCGTRRRPRQQQISQPHCPPRHHPGQPGGLAPQRCMRCMRRHSGPRKSARPPTANSATHMAGCYEQILLLLYQLASHCQKRHQPH